MCKCDEKPNTDLYGEQPNPYDLSQRKMPKQDLSHFNDKPVKPSKVKYIKI